jgi:hypothetical protein
MHTITSARFTHEVGSLVECEELVCPGCREQAYPEPPAGGRETAGVAVPEFSHRDGSELCGAAHGPRDPVEATR